MTTPRPRDDDEPKRGNAPARSEDDESADGSSAESEDAGSVDGGDAEAAGTVAEREAVAKDEDELFG